MENYEHTKCHEGLAIQVPVRAAASPSPLTVTLPCRPLVLPLLPHCRVFPVFLLPPSITHWVMLICSEYGGRSLFQFWLSGVPDHAFADRLYSNRTASLRTCIGRSRQCVIFLTRAQSLLHTRYQLKRWFFIGMGLASLSYV
jgi:hypothetical protein